MGQLRYRATKVDAEFLKNNFFFYSNAFSDPDDAVYVHRFPVYKWGSITTLEAEMRLHMRDWHVTVDVYDGQNTMTRGIYAPFYYQADYGHDEIVTLLIRNIEKERKRLGLVGDDDN